MYVEFILGKHVNYIDILEFHGVGHGMPQDRKGETTDPNHVRRPPRTPNPPCLYPPTGPVIDEMQETLFDLTDTLLRHGTVVEGNVGQGVGTSGAFPLHTQDPLTRSLDRTRVIDCTGDAEGSERHVIPHPCIACGGIFYGPASYFQDDGLLRYVSKTHSFHIIFCFISQF